MRGYRRQCTRDLAFLALLTCAGGTGWAQQGHSATAPWYWYYERGVTLVDQGRGQEARAALNEALRLKPDEGLRVRTDGPYYVDYLPHLYLAVASHMSGDVAAARLHLAEAERSGVAAQSETGLRLLTAFRALLAPQVGSETRATASTPLPPAPESPPRFRVYDRKPVVLSDSEFEHLRKGVLSRCQLSAADVRLRAPWYYHYELGLALARRGDNQRALDALIEAAQDKPEPQHLARTYGVWFLDYLPYLAIAKAHARLGNRECALDALAVSERLGEASEETSEIKALLSDLKHAK